MAQSAFDWSTANDTCYKPQHSPLCDNNEPKLQQSHIETPESNVDTPESDVDDEAKVVVLQTTDVHKNIRLSWWRYLIMYHRSEVCASLALILTLLSAILSGRTLARASLVKRPAARAVPFFRPDSVVKDLFDGNGFDFTAFFNDSEVTVILYYAPWASACHEFRTEFEQLAKHYTPKGQVRFVAVNCWDPGGQCRRMYRMFSFPVIGLHLSPANRHIFYQGPLLADHLHRFIEKSVTPMERLGDTVEFENFVASCDLCVVAYFDFNEKPIPWGYMNYLQTAFKALERDPFGDAVKFGIVTSKVASANAFIYSSQVRMYSVNWRCANATHCRSITYWDYLYSDDFSADKIIQWIYNNWDRERKRSHWVMNIPMGSSMQVKNDELMRIVSHRPTVIMIYPRQILFDKDGIEVEVANFKQIAAEYSSCGRENKERDLLLRRINVLHRSKLNRINSLIKMSNVCRQWHNKHSKLKKCCQEVVLTTVSVAPHYNICDVCPTPMQRAELDLHYGSHSNIPVYAQAVKGSSCNQVELNAIPPARIVDYCCDRRGSANVTPVHSKCTSRDIKNDHMDLHEIPPQCQRIRLAKLALYNLNITADVTMGISVGSTLITGMACANNKSLNFVSLDSSHLAFLAPKLGIDPTKTTLVILDNSTESRHVLEAEEGEISVKKMRSFIWNYSMGKLQNNRVESRAPESKTESMDKSRTLWIEPVYDIEKDVINVTDQYSLVIYSSPGCGACKGIHHIFQSAMYYFHSLNDKLKFRSIDVDSVNLPWKYTVYRVPSIIMYRGVESSAYPNDLPITLSNVISFVLASVDSTIRYRVSLDACVQTKSNQCLCKTFAKSRRRLAAIQSQQLRLRRISAGLGRDYGNISSKGSTVVPKHLTTCFAAILKSMRRLKWQKKAITELMTLLRSLNISRSKVEGMMHGWTLDEADMLDTVIKLTKHVKAHHVPLLL